MVLNFVMHRLNMTTSSRSSTWRERWAPTTSSSPTRSTTAGPASIATSCCRRREQLRARRGGHQQLPRARRRADEDLLRRARLLREAAEGLHERLGLGVPDDRRRRRRPALPRGAHAAGPRRSRMCASTPARDLVRLARPSTAIAATSWMKEPCRSCPEKTKDFGGCRCQAYLLTGDAANADPVCDKSPAPPPRGGSRGARPGRRAAETSQCSSSAMTILSRAVTRLAS